MHFRDATILLCTKCATRRKDHVMAKLNDTQRALRNWFDDNIKEKVINVTVEDDDTITIYAVKEYETTIDINAYWITRTHDGRVAWDSNLVDVRTKG